MPNIIGRWQAGYTDWLAIPLYEIILEQSPPKWLLTYRVCGERHALIGCDTEEQARRELAWLKTRCPMTAEEWIETMPHSHDSSQSPVAKRQLKAG
ncbi:hypothetical protein [Saccharopolyspora mangrovi]|uniref:Uncharacterized protein n=1 Tax=Saccharopolyspora mangrovi TaxID=3082379 RepID=A0ABU6AFD3_9PSEU|nr:hypothetical protein [Saccharopolyspora sp. S2-29]MEB3370141.1 hypothetical protein [Saccharopolyspora sp. S2-29]